MVSFVDFHDRGFALPADHFFCGLLHEYGIRLHHLTPNGIQGIATFVAICEGYLRIPPHFSLWRHFFGAQLLTPTANHGVPGAPFQLGCASIQLRGERAGGFFRMRDQTSNKGWYRWWFYLKNDADRGVPEIDNLVFPSLPECWHW